MRVRLSPGMFSMEKGEGVSLNAALAQRNWILGAGRLMLVAFLCSLIAACSSSTRSSSSSAVSQSGEPSRAPVTNGQYLVRRGDTLYSIAFRYGWDWKALAAHNNIDAPYTIRPGQTIRFDGKTGSQSSVAKNTPPVAPVVASKASSTPPATTKTESVKAAKNSSQSTSSAVSPAPVRGTEGWVWPTNGSLIGRFASNGSLNKGIDIAGQLGQPVLAASSGTVVYAGSGLRGYGELVIIKHSDTYVSAYGHNRRLLVQEGQQVKVGQSIAEMGSTGTDRVKLHFEIRRQGKPVDPLQYLPPR